MNILYLGKFFPKEILQTVNEDSKGKIGLSNHNFEMSVLNGLCLQDDVCLRCITIPGVFSFPRSNKKLFTHSEFYRYRNTFITSVGFCNLMGVKELWVLRKCVKQIKKEIEKFPAGIINVIINTPDIRLLSALDCVRKSCRRRITQTVIIPDVPSMVTSMDKHNWLKRILLNDRDQKSMAMTSQSDGLVLLTEAMMDFISKPVKHLVMEGIVDIDTMRRTDIGPRSDKKVILYTGTLRKIFGVMNLVEAFEMIEDKDVELWICGSGDAKESIENAAKRDPRIVFKGFVDSAAALDMQYEATILINPRTSEGEYTKYSFPSKTMEYLLAGRSVITNRLPGIPEEYYDYVYTPQNESIKALAECIMHVLHLNKNLREIRSKAGRQFILEQKNSKVQMERVIKMIASYS